MGAATDAPGTPDRVIGRSPAGAERAVPLGNHQEVRLLMRRMLLALGLALGLGLPALTGLTASAAPASAGGVIVQIDNPTAGEQNMTPNWIAGWAVDTGAVSGTGIDSVSVYLDGDATN